MYTHKQLAYASTTAPTSQIPTTVAAVCAHNTHAPMHRHTHTGACAHSHTHAPLPPHHRAPPPWPRRAHPLPAHHPPPRARGPTCFAAHAAPRSVCNTCPEPALMVHAMGAACVPRACMRDLHDGCSMSLEAARVQRQQRTPPTHLEQACLTVQRQRALAGTKQQGCACARRAACL